MALLLPVYYQIKQTIRSWIVNKEFNPGDRIPSESELADKFGVSRLTVRQALSQLIQEGFLNSRKGEGTFVTHNEDLINSFSLEFSGFMDDLFYQVSKVQTKSVILSRTMPTKWVRNRLQLDSEEKEVLQIKRVRFLRDKVFSYTINYFSKVKMTNNKDKPSLLAIKRGRRIFSKPLKPGEAPQKSKKTEEKRR